ncbi:MAG: DJ-1/PfpI family protein [Labilithrix sp.]|nr:DJ-1/PfpI family protein [Labilithrix sp.]
MARVLMPLPDRDFDPTESAVPWKVLTRAGHEVVFATEGGAVAACDPLLIDGVIFGQLGAKEEPKRLYAELAASRAFLAPITWEAIEAGDYDALLLPGGHAQGMKPYLESDRLQQKVALFARTGRPMAAICHGVLVAARARDPETGKSVLYGRKTTCLPAYMERTAYALTAWKLGRYYRTYDAYVEDEVKAALEDPSHFVRGPITLTTHGTDDKDDGAFVVEDGAFVSARWPGDAYLFAKKLLARL